MNVYEITRRMDRKEIARQTLDILDQGYYELAGRRVDIAEAQALSEQNSFLLTPQEGGALVAELTPPAEGSPAACRVANQSAVEAILALSREGACPAVLNFASAKNPGGGFLKGAMAQEEALAASSGLYRALLRHPAYYENNRAFKSMVYTDHAIYCPKAVFFRDGGFGLLPEPATASVLTLPAVNLGQVIQKGEDVEAAKAAMKNRMRLVLAIFARQKDRHLILGAYGCGVFGNDPAEVAPWWRELLVDEGWGRCFTKILFAVLDRAKNRKAITAFEEVFGPA